MEYVSTKETGKVTWPGWATALAVLYHMQGNSLTGKTVCIPPATGKTVCVPPASGKIAVITTNGRED